MRTNDYNVELETALQELVFNLLGNGVKTNIGVGTDFFSSGSHGRNKEDRDEYDAKRMEVDDNAVRRERPNFPPKTHSIRGSKKLLILFFQLR